MLSIETLRNLLRFTNTLLSPAPITNPEACSNLACLLVDQMTQTQRGGGKTTTIFYIKIMPVATETVM
jgi:hypothetical protein